MEEAARSLGRGLQTEPLELLILGDEHYVLDLRLSGTGTRSGVEVDQRFAFLYDLRPDGKIGRARLFPDVATAISVAESAASQTA